MKTLPSHGGQAQAAGSQAVETNLKLDALNPQSNIPTSPDPKPQPLNPMQAQSKPSRQQWEDFQRRRNAAVKQQGFTTRESAKQTYNAPPPGSEVLCFWMRFGVLGACGLSTRETAKEDPRRDPSPPKACWYGGGSADRSSQRGMHALPRTLNTGGITLNPCAASNPKLRGN